MVDTLKNNNFDLNKYLDKTQNNPTDYNLPLASTKADQFSTKRPILNEAKSEGNQLILHEEKKYMDVATQLIKEFDLTGNGVIGPTEFFNIIMAQFE